MQRNNTNSFINIVFNLLEENKHPELFCWDSQGECILIKQLEMFSLVVLKSHFGHENFHSFVRQLNMYNFRKTKRDTSIHAYFNPFFKRGERNLLNKIQRRKVLNKKKGLEEPKGEPESSRSTHYQNSFEDLNRPEEKSDGCLEAIRDLTFENKVMESSLEMLKDELYELKMLMAETVEHNLSLKSRIDRVELEEQNLKQQFYFINKTMPPPNGFPHKKVFSSGFKPSESLEFYKASNGIQSDYSHDKNSVFNDSVKLFPWNREDNYWNSLLREEHLGAKNENNFSCFGYRGFD